MWNRTIYIGKVFSIPVRLHVTWIWAIVLITAALVIYYQGILSFRQSVILGISVSLLLFVSMCIRELGRIYVLKIMRVPIQNINMYVFGGVPRIPEEKVRHIPELLIACTGPLLNLIIAGLTYIFYLMITTDLTSFTGELIQWVVYFNILIVIFNILPGYPLDLGRILRSILWKITGNFSKATRRPILAGQIIGVLLIIGGISGIVTAMEWFTGALTLFAGWFLLTATFTSRRRIRVRDALRGFTAQSMMTDDFTPIKQQLTFNLVRDFIINSGQYCFVVIEEGELKGIVTLRDIQIPKRRWNKTKISDMMTPVKKLKTSTTDQPAAYLLEQMEENNIEQIPVIEAGNIVGMVKKGQLIRFLKARAVLRA